MKKLSVATMRCEKCVARISAALAEAGIAFEISLADKLVAVEETKVAEAIEALDDLGFEAVEAQGRFDGNEWYSFCVEKSKKVNIFVAMRKCLYYNCNIFFQMEFFNIYHIFRQGE